MQNLYYFWRLRTEMLQRIQTIFMILAVLSAAALHFTAMDVELFGSTYIIAALSLLCFVLGVISIFSYKNRPRQILLNNISMLINALLTGLLLYWLLILSGGMSFPEKGIELVFPLVALLCLFLANSYIRRDTRLVKSADRIR